MIKSKIKRLILYIFGSTGAVLLLLAIFAMFDENTIIYAETIFQIFGANILITIGLSLTQKIESRHAILDFLLDIGFMITIIIIFGILFKWFSFIPVWIPIVIVVIVYLLFYLLDTIRVREDLNEINGLLKKLKEKESDSAS